MFQQPNEVTYLDNAASTRPAAEVVEAMIDVMQRDYGNPSSRHAMGLAAEHRVRRARAQVAARLGVPPAQVVFTSGGSEALALALLGTGAQRRQPGHVLVSAVEHPAVLRTAPRLQQLGHTVEEVPVTPGGWVDPQEIVSRLRDDTFLLALMHVNNETGIVQPVELTSALVRERLPDCRILVDAVQSFGVLDTRLQQLGADLVAVSGHKIHGPKGIGALALSAAAKLTPLWEGGRQEFGFRPGTENVPGVVGFGVAAELGKGDPAALRQRCERVAEGFTSRVPGAHLLGDGDRRAPHIAAIALPKIRSDVLVNALGQRGVYLSSGAACHSRGKKRSHVLRAMGVPDDHGVVRVSPSRYIAEEELVRAVEAMISAIGSLS